MINFIYSSLIKFQRTNKINGVPIPKNLINNLKCIINNKAYIHHSQINGEITKINKIYDFQDTIILCQIFEQRSEQLQRLFRYSPRKCNSASSFSGCVQRDQSKCLIAHPNEVEHVRVFEKTLIGGFNSVNIRLAFDTQVLLNDKETGKAVFDLQINGKKHVKRISLY